MAPNALAIEIDVESTDAVRELKKVDTAIAEVGTTAKESNSALAVYEGQVRKLVDTKTELATVTVQTTGTLQTLRGTLNEVAEGAGVTYTNLGLMGSAFSAVAAAQAGWQIGRFIADLAGTDEAIGNVTARLIGLGDVMAQTAGAKQDVIDLAIKRHADAHITYADALKFNAEWFVKWQTQAKEMDDQAARIHAPQEIAEQMAKWNAEIDKVRQAGSLPALTEAIQRHLVPLNQLADSYRLSPGAINLFKIQIEEEAAAHTKATAEAAKHATELRHLMEEVRKIEDEKDAFTLAGFEKLNQAEAKANMTRMTEHKAGLVQIQKAEEELADAIAKATLSSTDYQLLKINEHVAAQKAAFTDLLGDRERYYAAVDALAARETASLIAKAQAVAAAEAASLTIVVGHGPDVPNSWASGGFSLGGGGLHPLTGAYSLAGGLPFAPPGALPLTGFAEGGPVLRDGPIYAHAGEYVIPARGDQRAAEKTIIQLVVDGRVLASVVNEVNTKSLRQRRLLPSN